MSPYTVRYVVDAWISFASPGTRAFGSSVSPSSAIAHRRRARVGARVVEDALQLVLVRLVGLDVGISRVDQAAGELLAVLDQVLDAEPPTGCERLVRVGQFGVPDELPVVVDVLDLQFVQVAEQIGQPEPGVLQRPDIDSKAVWLRGRLCTVRDSQLASPNWTRQARYDPESASFKVQGPARHVGSSRRCRCPSGAVASPLGRVTRAYRQTRTRKGISGCVDSSVAQRRSVRARS